MPFEYLEGHFNYFDMKTPILLLLFILYSSVTFSQVYKNPIAAKQSHPELEITKIQITDNETVVSLKVTNKLSTGGWFCADKNIYLKSSKGNTKYELLKSENIPTCPDKHEFALSGETLEFKLYFPPIPDTIKYIDLIEDCSNACFSFHGIILDNEHNEKIRSFETGFDLFGNNEFEKSIPYFERVLDGKPTVDSHIYGLSYYYLVVIYDHLGDKEKMNLWYKKLLDSDLDDKDTFIKELKNKVNIQ